MDDWVIVHEDEDFVADQTRKFFKGKWVYKEEIVRRMVGKIYSVVPTEASDFDDNWASLNMDYDYNGQTCYFPKTTLRKFGDSKWIFTLVHVTPIYSRSLERKKVQAFCL